MVKTLELNTNLGNYDQSRVRPAFQDPDNKGYILLKKGQRQRQKALSFLHKGIIKSNSFTLELVIN